jgi:DNA primase
MGKISPVSAKYIVHSSIEIEGVVERPDVIGAIFGQTEGLLGSDLELRELQRSGRIGRIEVNVDTRSGKTQGSIIIPSSLDKAETSIVAAALEIIQRIGPCNAKIKVSNIEDVRVSKRKYVIERAKELLKQMTERTMPDSQELADEVAHSVRMMEVQQYGKDRLAAGPAIDESDEIIVVEGRADVLNMLKHGIKNAVAMNGTSCPETIKELSRKKIVTAFVDGDRGGNLIIKELTEVADLDYVTRAPDGKEVEELSKKEMHKAIRGRVTAEQAKMELLREAEKPNGNSNKKTFHSAPKPVAPVQRFAPRKGRQLSDDERNKFKGMLEDLIGTRGAYVLDEKMNMLGKVPLTELGSTIKSLGSGTVYAVVFDGVIDRTLVEVAERSSVKHLVAMDSRVRGSETRVNLVTAGEL